MPAALYAFVLAAAALHAGEPPLRPAHPGLEKLTAAAPAMIDEAEQAIFALARLQERYRTEAGSTELDRERDQAFAQVRKSDDRLDELHAKIKGLNKRLYFETIVDYLDEPPENGLGQGKTATTRTLLNMAPLNLKLGEIRDRLFDVRRGDARLYEAAKTRLRSRRRMVWIGAGLLVATGLAAALLLGRRIHARRS